jgi:hypothetical protein
MGMQSKKTTDLLAEFVNEKDCIAESGVALARLGNNKTRSNGFTIAKCFKLREKRTKRRTIEGQQFRIFD